MKTPAATSSGPHDCDTRSHRLIGDVHLLLLDSGGRVLLSRRQNTDLLDGTYHVQAGHLEAGESVVQAVIREAREELGITIAPEHVEFAHIMHSPVNGGRASFFFYARNWTGTPANLEPDKCSDLSWFPLDALPQAMTTHSRAVLSQIAAGIPFSVRGWGCQAAGDTERRGIWNAASSALAACQARITARRPGQPDRS